MFFIDSNNQDDKNISTFIYVPDYALGFVIVAILKVELIWKMLRQVGLCN